MGKLFQRLNGWIVRRVWNFRYWLWHNWMVGAAERRMCVGLGLVNIPQLIPDREGYHRQQGCTR